MTMQLTNDGNSLTTTEGQILTKWPPNGPIKQRVHNLQLNTMTNGQLTGDVLRMLRFDWRERTDQRTETKKIQFTTYYKEYTTYNGLEGQLK